MRAIKWPTAGSAATIATNAPSIIGGTCAGCRAPLPH
jgi:hypothetical protein